MEVTRARLAVETTRLIEENQQLRARLQDLLQQANDNQQILQRHHELNLKLIAADGFIELIDDIFETLPHTSSLDVVSLLIIDAQDEVHDMMANLNLQAGQYSNLLLLRRHEKLNHDLVFLQKPEVGPYVAARHGHLFSVLSLIPASVAVIPLHRHHKLIGFLNLGSLQTNRFTKGMATDFIEVQASIVAICLENVMNHERLKHISLSDPLTGVRNRRYIEKRLHEEISLAQRHGTTLSCLYIDIDHFKLINDSLGHAHGDDVLCEVAARILNELRISDVLGRVGGEEFVVLLPHIEARDALMVAERIRISIGNERFQPDSGEAHPVTISIGISTMPAADRKQSPKELAQFLLSRADGALYQAKKEGRNRVVCCD